MSGRPLLAAGECQTLHAMMGKPARRWNSRDPRAAAHRDRRLLPPVADPQQMYLPPRAGHHRIGMPVASSFCHPLPRSEYAEVAGALFKVVKVIHLCGDVIAIEVDNVVKRDR